MIALAQEIVREREIELLKWLKSQYREAVRRERAAAKAHQYGEAHHDAGIAAAYAYVILHLERTMLPKKVRR